jgi:hypothetical protein
MTLFIERQAVAALPTIRAAIGLARKYVENGTAAAKQIEYGFYRDADRIAAEVIADYVARFSVSDALFNVAREIERAAMSADLPSYDQMSSEAKSLLGVFLDFNAVSREKIAMTWPRGAKVSVAKDHVASDAPGDVGPLFTESEPKAGSGPAHVKNSHER